MCYKKQVKKYLEYCEFRKELDWNTLKAYKIDLKQFFEYTKEDISEKYTDKSITYGIIELHFIEEIPQSANKFLQVVQDQVGKLGIRIQYLISKVDGHEA